MTFLTADLHFGHGNILKYVDRPFTSVEEMDETLIKNINDTVGSDDTLYVLGDFTMGGSYTKCRKYLDRINCQDVRLVLGNHDKRFLSKGKQSPFTDEMDYYELHRFGINIVMSHYPMDSWNGRDYGYIMCHGHIHASKRYNQINSWHHIYKYDVGVDANDYRPVSIYEIVKFFTSTE